MDPVAVVATPSAAIPGVNPPTGAQILAEAAAERAKLTEQAAYLMQQSVRRSDQVEQIALALSKAQGKIKAAERDSKNPFYKSTYSSLSAVWDACREALSENEIAVVQPLSGSGRLAVITTLLLHSSGQWIEERLILTAREDTPQAIASAATYGR